MTRPLAPKSKHNSFYDGAYRVVKDGVPMRVPLWYKDLTADGKRMILAERPFSKPYGKNMPWK